MFKGIIAIAITATFAYHAKGQSEWPAYGRDAGGTRYSPLKQINESNVSKLKPAWTFNTGELETYKGTELISKSAFETTPLMIGETLYFTTPTCRVFAVNASTGKQVWMYDPQVNLRADYSEVTSRGVSAWPAAKGNAPTKPQIIFVPTIDGRLIALHPETGKPLIQFGVNGTVDLKAGLGRDLSVTSPPAVIGNLVVIGSSLGDNQQMKMTRGAVRAYDVHSGQLKWTWDPIPRDSLDPAWNTWQGPNAHESGAANAWSVISADPDRDLVFVPCSAPSPDYYGGERHGQNLYGNSLVALHASTGKVAWYFQVVHHDLWDYDIAAQPILAEIIKDGKKTPVVIVGTKMGHVFVLHRETGKPVFPVEERPVPASTVAGESAWPTQPFPVLPAPLGLQKVGVENAWGLNEAEWIAATERIKQFTSGGIFTPPSYGGTIITPGNVGGIHWGGMSYDPGRGLLVTNINHLAAIIRMIPRDSLEMAERQNKDLIRAETGRQAGTPYVMKRDYLFKVDTGGMKIQTAPPWGTLLAIDMKTGEKKWEVPLGFMLDPRKYPGAEKWGSLNLGGAITTAGNLTFVAASLDGHLRAFSTSTGKLLWQYLLPATAQATPMTYSIKGKQYVVIAAGGHGKLRTRMGDALMAFSVD
jgi:quinoprotein glucose dehydrogenase